MDDFDTHQNTLSAPAIHADAITPSDSQPLTRATRAIYVGGAGNLHLRLVSGGDVVFQNVQAGGVYPLRIAQVLASGTTATGLVGLR